jgi:virulence-associated protein VagC
VNRANRGPLAFGGGSLLGTNLARFVYMDETGVANPAQEPWLVVAGIIVEPDRHWFALEEKLRELADEYAPKEHREGFVFHATELWSGGKIMQRETYPAERRWEALKRICALPGEFEFPVVKGAIHRESYRRMIDPNLSDTDVTADAQLAAFTECLTVIEQFMRHDAGPQEVAKITVEYSSNNYRLFKEHHRTLKSPASLANMHPVAALYWPIRRIVDSVEACDKQDTSLLQIADACAFIVRKKLEGHPEADAYLEGFADNVMGFQPMIHSDFIQAAPS